MNGGPRQPGCEGPLRARISSAGRGGARTLLDRRVYLEGPRWRDGALYVSDVLADEVLRVTLDGQVDIVAARAGLHPSGLGWAHDGQLLIVAARDRDLLRVVNGKLAPFADLSVAATSLTNDMAVDPKGRAFIGQAGSDIAAGEPLRPAPLVRVDPDGSVHRVGSDLLCANGMVVADGGQTLLVAETFGDRITAFDIGSDGSLSGQRVWAPLPKGHAPDGICLDVEGALWVGCPFAQRFLRIAEGGEKIDEIAVPGRNAIACTLGGEQGTTLFMITWEPTGPSPDASGARTGRVELAEVAIASAGQP